MVVVGIGNIMGKYMCYMERWKMFLVKVGNHARYSVVGRG